MSRGRRAPTVAAALAVGSVLAAAGPAPLPASAQAARLALAPAYDVQRVDSPTPAQGGQLGWLGIANAGDLDGDGRDDLLVPQYDGTGSIHLVSGASGSLIRTLTLPDPAAAGTTAGNFVYPAKLADLGSCPGGQVSRTCPVNPVGPRDGVPEVVVGAYGVDLETPDLGRAYVFDGATGAVLKRVQMPPADRAAESSQFPGGKGFGFGRGVVSPASAFPDDAPDAVRIGDLDGGGAGDFAVGNPTFYEQGPATNPSCTPGPCPGSGRVYVYRGEDIAGSDPNAVLESPWRVIRNPMAQTGPPDDRFGHAILPVGDVGRCTIDPGPGAACPEASRSSARDGRPDLVVAQHQAEFPAGFPSAGVVWLLDGPTGAVLNMYAHPEPQAGSLFGYTVGTMSTAVGDVGNTVAPDILVAAVGQGVQFTHQGRAYVLNGNYLASASGITLGRLDDPTPHRGENFGAPFAGLGDVAGDPRNEVLIGNAGPWQSGDADNRFVGDVHVVDPAAEQVVRSFADPDETPNGGFGQGVAQLGDINGDGYLDFAVTAGFYSGATFRQGRLYIFRSVAPGAAPSPSGYLLAAGDGGVFAFGGAGFHGSAAAGRGASPVVAVESTPGGGGYWLATADGGVLAFGDAGTFGPTQPAAPPRQVVALRSTPTGRGYWLATADGAVVAYGDARAVGSMASRPLARPIVAMAVTPTGAGYWLVAADGGVFAFGDARFAGSTGALRLVAPVVGAATTSTGGGYWLVAADGGVFAFGDARFAGSMGGRRLASPVVGLAGASAGGYWLCARDGGVFAFGAAAFAGSMGGRALVAPVVACAAPRPPLP